jgi:murein DD-endopeptidase MepM/ murein hydrolase activator NlpD
MTIFEQIEKPLKWVILFYVVAVLNSNCCKDNEEPDPGPDPAPDVISMITPFLTTSGIASINEAFSSSVDPPWGFKHDGIDFFTAGKLSPFQAVSSGTIEEFRLWQNTDSSNWQVNVRIKYNSVYSVGYAFEPFSTVQSDGQIQLANMYVSLGQTIAQGTIIGNLYHAAGGAHVHFGFYKNNEPICPEPYFTPEARDSILYLIHKDHPDWDMCYPPAVSGL